MGAHVRGDATFVIGEETYTVKPSFKVLSAMEAATGMGIAELQGMVPMLRVNVLAGMIFHAIRAEGYEDVSYIDVGNAVVATLDEKDKPLVKACTDLLLAFFPKTTARVEAEKAEAAKTDPKPRKAKVTG